MEMQIKITMRDHLHPLQQLEFKRLVIPNLGDNEEQLEGSYVVGRSVKWYDHFANLGVSQKVKPILTVRFQSQPRSNENMSTKRYV